MDAGYCKRREKSANVVIPSGARNPSCIVASKKKEGSLTSFGMTSLGPVFCRPLVVQKVFCAHLAGGF